MKKILLVCGMLLILAIVLTGCQQAPAPTTARRVAMVLPGLKTDEAFNQFTYEGMMRAAEDCDIETGYIEEVAQDEQLEAVRQFAEAGYDIVIGQGGQFGEAIMTVAQEYPDQDFIFSIALETGGIPNVTAVTVSYRHIGYLAGVMACNMTTTNKIGMVTGEWYEPHEQALWGFEAGAATCGKDIEVNSVATGSWSDVTKAREASLAFVADGADVLWPLLDAAYVGVLSAAEDSDDVLVVGGVIDMSPVSPETVVGSVLLNFEEVGYQEACGNYVDGGVHILGIAEGGVGVVVNDLLSDEGKAAVDEAVAGLKSGELGIDP
jgi:basic membrane protein A